MSNMTHHFQRTSDSISTKSEASDYNPLASNYFTVTKPLIRPPSFDISQRSISDYVFNIEGEILAFQYTDYEWESEILILSNCIFLEKKLPKFYTCSFRHEILKPTINFIIHNELKTKERKKEGTYLTVF